MGDAIFPTLRGRAWPITREPRFNTILHKAASGREFRVTNQITPTYDFTLKYNYLRQDDKRQDLQVMEDFFLDAMGSLKSFYFEYPAPYPGESPLWNAQIAVGDGVRRTFDVFRVRGERREPIFNFVEGQYTFAPLMWNPWNSSQQAWTRNADPMWVNGREWQRADWMVTPGSVTFNAAPAVGEPVVVTTRVYWRARFADDYLSLDHFCKEFHEAQQVKLVACMGNLI